ncbi:MAG: YafY family transcriptional regulator, partial [Clostridiales bacterium]|nr:YafY family transcriptional regulator [Clostridiales bacterium]
MQINRLFEIVYLLMDHKNLTAKELAGHFEVSPRTILRDIDTLSSAGIPVYTSQGKGGGIFIRESYVLNKTVISESEQNQILFALQSMAATRQAETEGILSRLRSLFDKEDKDWIEADFSRWGNSAADKAKFASLKNALLNERAVSFTYYNSGGEASQRRVCPLKLLFKSTAWYLQAFCLTRQDYRTFKVSRMSSVEVLEEAFNGKEFRIPKAETPVCLPPSFIKVKLRIMPQAAYRIYDEFEEKDIIINEDGSYIVTIDLPEDQWLYEYILSFGAAAEVLAPLEVRRKMLRQAEKIKNIYAAK